MASEYGYDIPGDNTGECWAISAHANGDGTICGGTYDGVNLSTLYKEHRELFGNSKEEVFPLLIKIIDAWNDHITSNPSSNNSNTVSYTDAIKNLEDMKNTVLNLEKEVTMINSDFKS